MIDAPTPEQIFREHAPRIFSVARRMLNHDADAEDVTGDVLMQVVRKLHTFRGDAAITTWLHRLTVHAALAYREKRANRRMHEDSNSDFAADLESPFVPKPLPRMWVQSTEGPLLAAEERSLIESAIAALPPIYRDVFVLADVEELPNAEIGELLGLSLPAVKSRLHRARLLMRDRLAPQFEEGPPV
jgi:RNA polymerase sigma-70 factor, ECF subfamily